ncbi:MAG: alanine racemase [Treponema sp.]|nr:alanine racemase [Treponema sp.]
MRATQALIHLDNFASNFRIIRERIGMDKQICLPVKANAYGHGAVQIARKGLELGASCLAVAAVSEGAELRTAGISCPILLFSQLLPEEIPEIIENGLIPFVSDNEFAGILNKAAAIAGIRLPVHLKIDTGMGRMGCSPVEAPGIARKIAACEALAYAGTATHLAVSDSAESGNTAYTRRQIDCFRETVDRVRQAGVDPGIVHAANSGAVILHPEAWFDMVRPGILLYGYNIISGNAGPDVPLRVYPVMELRTSVVMIKKLAKGETVSYGRTWTAQRDTCIAVLPAGYADGLPRSAGNRWQVSIGGAIYPLAGRICMDQCMVDLGPETTVRRWDEASLFGGPAPDASVLAERTGTIPYEITCNINKRVPRVFTENGEKR